jgi:tRNA(Ile)-lysidine synthase
MLKLRVLPAKNYWQPLQSMLDPKTLSQLKHHKNLLAFSGGADSTALFYLLHDAGIAFDIALVNYHTRKESDQEAAFARELANRYGLRCFIDDARVPEKNFEHEARAVRYDFFTMLIRNEGYENLITAHQLDDRFEWLLMQLSKGAGLAELIGMYPIEKAEEYTLVRPLLRQSKSNLIAYLKENEKRWFDDASNTEVHYKRNYFRHYHSAPLLEKYHNGIKKSFDFLEEDIDSLLNIPKVENIGELYYFSTPSDRRSTLTAIDRTLKRCGFLMRRGDREILKHHNSTIAGRRYVIAIGDTYTFIAPYLNTVLEKSFKEQCRKLRIEPKLRPYLASAPDAFAEVKRLAVPSEQS